MMENTFSSRAEKAVEYKHNGNNCAQAVLLAFQDELKKSETELKQMGAAFGLGMGGMQATCGALCGAAIAFGYLNQSGKPAPLAMRDMVEKFRERAGALTCEDLKGVKTKKVLCPCDDCVRHAVTILEQQLSKQ